MIVRLTVDIEVPEGTRPEFVARSVDGELEDAWQSWSPSWQVGTVTAEVISDS